MQNNSMAMLALISLVAAPASLVGYIDPATCTVQSSDVFISCQQAADQHIWACVLFAVFGIGTFAISFIRRKLQAKRHQN